MAEMMIIEAQLDALMGIFTLITIFFSTIGLLILYFILFSVADTNGDSDG